MAASSASSINNSVFDVFLCFQGEDTRYNFVDYLYAALDKRGIRTYKDGERFKQGNNMLEEHNKSIENSKFCIIVFSKNFASSTWCLDELVEIMKSHKTYGQFVYPVYYDVQPSEVRRQTGAVGEAFDKLKNNEAAKKWREALKEAGNFVGWDMNYQTDGHGPAVIKEIVDEISLRLLDATNFTSAEELVGMKPRIKDIESCIAGLDDVRLIGIKGMGGVGKTTLARAIYDKMSIQFEGKSFVENISEVSGSASSGLKSLQEKLLSEVLCEKGINVRTVHDGKHMMKMMLCNKKVLVVLDDVDHIDQLEALAGNWFRPGSIIIITARDEQVLGAHGAKLIYDVPLLSDKESMCLFSRLAFGREIPIQDYKELSGQVVRYAAGLPLTIKVLGSFLCGKEKSEWVDALERLEKIPLKETIEKLELSYLSLEDDYKEIFLDVACLLKGSKRDDAIRILESCGFHAKHGLRVLEQKSLITISSDEHLCMHDHIQRMGKNITRRLHPDEPNRHSRLWIHDEILDILLNDMGTEATRAIVMYNPLNLDSEIITKGFRYMKQLRLLSLVSEINDECNVKTDQVGLNLPNALRFLSWVGYPHCSLPVTFQANNLVALEMPYSRLVQLWEGGGGGKVLHKLRFLNLRHSMLRTIDLGMTPNLERLDLEDCYDLVQLHSPDGCRTLEFLNLSGCSAIESFSFLKQMESLKVLCLSRLYLNKFPDFTLRNWNNSLLELRFRYNKIEELPSSIGNLQNLINLELHSCKKLGSLPESICGLRHLLNLNLSGCILEELPKDIDKLESLEKLNLSFTRIKHLPDRFCMLNSLKTLNLSSCWSLEKLPEDLGKLECLQNLILTECTRIRYIPNSISQLKRLKYLGLLGCIQLEKLPEELGVLECLEVLNVKGTFIRHIPRSISLLKGLKIYGPKSGLLLRGFAPTPGVLDPSYIKKQKIDHVTFSSKTKVNSSSNLQG